jgi:hypothetical protein
MCANDAQKYAAWAGDLASYTTFQAHEVNKRNSLPNATYAVPNDSADLSDIAGVVRKLNQANQRFYKASNALFVNVRTDSGCLATLKTEPDSTERDLVNGMADSNLKTQIQGIFSSLDSSEPGWDTQLELIAPLANYSGFITDCEKALGALDPERILPLTKYSSMDLVQFALNAFVASGAIPAVVPSNALGITADNTPFHVAAGPAPIVLLCQMPTTHQARIAMRMENFRDELKATTAGNATGQTIGQYPPGDYEVRVYQNVADDYAVDAFGALTTIKNTVFGFDVPGLGMVEVPHPSPCYSTVFPQIDAMPPQRRIYDQSTVFAGPTAPSTVGNYNEFLGQLIGGPNVTITVVDVTEVEVRYHVNIRGTGSTLAIFQPDATSLWGGNSPLSDMVVTIELLEDEATTGGLALKSVIGGALGSSTGQLYLETTQFGRDNTLLNFLRFVNSVKGGKIQVNIAAEMQTVFNAVSSIETVNSVLNVPAIADSADIGGLDMLSFEFWTSHQTARTLASNALSVLSKQDKMDMYCQWVIALRKNYDDNKGDINLVQRYLGTNVSC